MLKMPATAAAVALFVLVALLQLTGAVDFGAVAWIVVSAAVLSGAVVDVVRARS